ncbi:MarR family transcriptional regulator [Gordonia sp. HNM0687]|uniref:MarR family transcriptional regulator n=2 Tax=Gordonia mangrovi TaxID=2665643 RepID=A0A6L7GJZ5_9ACTN|nr:MarR family transcriptional regulator [Gordonia mangrovi]MDY6807650.1 MarR family transcriptional regulator [Actinomycetota bacterium]MXP19763.1 MarR family transcriptional regulator [Gordonia mangrovi]UVF80632.1 MarR family transcriptional regulator [Gordonia mangrovi]
MSDMPDVGDESFWLTPLYQGLAEELLRMGRRKTHIVPGAVLEASAFTILWTLSDGAPRTLRDLADELDLEQSTVNRQVNAAIKHGYLERFEVTGQASRLIRPTPAGQAAFEHDGRLRADRLRRVFADLDPGTPEALLHELRAFNDAYERTYLRQHEAAQG